MRKMFIAAVSAVLAAGFMAPAAYAEERPWRVTRTPLMVSDAGLSRVAALGPEEVWVGGHEGRFCYDWSIPLLGAGRKCEFSTTVKRWNGVFWETKNPPATWNLELLDLDASSSGNVWFAGEKNLEDRFFRWDGNKWNEIVLPTGICSSISTVSGLSLTAVGTDELWAAWGRECVMHWKAGEWTVHPTPGLHIEKVHALGANDVYLSPVSPARKPLHWDGASWAEVNGVPNAFLVGVDGDGSYYAELSNLRSVKHVSNGVTTALPLSPEPLPGSTADEYLLDAEGSLWRVDKTVAHRFDGASWQSTPLPVGSVTDVDPLPAPAGSLWAVGTAPDGTPASLTNS
ncbi:hypothetical protein [Actinocorallia aurantiaca]